MDLPAQRRALAIDPAFAPGLDQLRRGWVVGCSGPASMSVAMALVATPMAAGSWTAVVGVPMFGIEAAAEYGVPLSRLVGVDAGGGAGEWAERVAAAAVGFELVVTSPPRGADRQLRRVRQRLHAAGSVLVAVSPGDPSISCDVVVDTVSTTWHGLGVGHGRLLARSVHLRVDGRRVARPVDVEVWLPTRFGGLGVDEDDRLLVGREHAGRRVDERPPDRVVRAG